MKKAAVVWVCAVMVLSSLVFLPAGTGADGGRDAQRAPTMIYNVNDLQNMSVGLGNDYALANDIDASATSGWNGGAGFQPVGDGSRQFTGTFDGKGYNITGLTINRGNQDYIGFFGFTSSPARLTNVNLVNATIAGRYFVGGIAGYLYYGTISGCSFNGAMSGREQVGGLAGHTTYGSITSSFTTGSISAGNLYCGGITGILERTPVSMCYSTASVAGYYYTGGLAGYTYESSIYGSYFAGSVKGSYNTGGLIGAQSSGSITNSYNTGDVQNSNDQCGGVIGYTMGGGISRCYNTGQVSGYRASGGISGLIETGTVSECYSTGSVVGTYYVGGICGIYAYSSIYYSYSSGFIQGSNYAGGLAGYAVYSGWAYDFWDVQKSGYGSSAGGTGKTTDEMKTQTTFANWDFTNTWNIFGGTTYPYLRWRYPAALILSGTAYSDAGITPLGAGAPVLVVDHLGLSVAHYPARTDFSGHYVQMVDNGTFFAAVTKTPSKGSSYGRENSAQSYILDIYKGTVFAKAAPGKKLSVNDIQAVTAAFRTEPLPALVTGTTGLAYTAGYPFVTADGTVFETDRNLSATGGADLRFGGRFAPTKDVLLTAGNITFNAASVLATGLSLNCTGDIVFREAFSLGDLTIVNAKDVLAWAPLVADNYDQLNGTGVTDFSRGRLQLGGGDASIITHEAVGWVVAGTLSLGTDLASIIGSIDGSSGQAGADKITLLNKIRIGTHFFDGIDLYKFSPADVTVATEDELYSVDYQPMNPGDALTWSVETEAGWLSMETATGVLSGTPGNGDIGSTDVTVTAHDGPKSVSRTFMLEVLNVNDPPEILTEDVLDAIEDEPYSVLYEAVDIDPTNDELQWALETDAGWLGLDGSRLWGTPSNDDVGEYWANITVSDGNGGTASHNFTLTVENVNDGPRITVEPATTASEDVEYRVAFNATDIDGDDTLNWSLRTTAAWLRIDTSTGVLSGTPSNGDIGLYWVEVTVKDDEGALDSLGFMLTVLNVNDEPVWVSVPADQTLMEGDALLLDVLASDVDKGDTVRYSLSSEPASGMLINPASGALRWTGAAPGSYAVTLTATDGTASITYQFNLTVSKRPLPPANNPPKIGTITVSAARAGQAFAYKLIGNDSDSADAANLTFRLVSGPAGMIVSADGNILWIPAKDQAGSHTVTVAISDGKDTTTAVFTVDVKKPTAAAASSTGFNEGWLVAMLLLGLLIGVLLAFVLTRGRPKAAEPEPAQPAPYPMQPLPAVESPRAHPAEPPQAPPAEPMQTVPPPEPAAAPQTPPAPEPAVEKKPPQPDFKP